MSLDPRRYFTYKGATHDMTPMPRSDGMTIKQHSKHKHLTKLRIQGTHEELRTLALDILYAIDAGTSRTMVGTTRIKIKASK